ncbi:MAG: hypothetical protein KDA85_21070, partial [Planctomycetaceae bacterium]|nr:hypothetical protein [Planctomycetaceae bacterium]
MATVSEQLDSSFAECDEFIDFQVETARERIRWTDVLTASVVTGLLLISYVLLFTVLDHWVIAGGFNPWVRAAGLILVLAATGAIAFRFVLRPMMQQIHPLFAARALDQGKTGLDGSLLAVVDLQAAGRKVRPEIYRSLEKRAAVRLAHLNVDEVIDRRFLTRMSVILLVLVTITCLYAVFSPKKISLLRPLSFAQASVATQTVIHGVQPGTVTVPAGQQVEIIADLGGVIPDRVVVEYTTADQQYVDAELVMEPTDQAGRFRVVMMGTANRGVRQETTYRVKAGDTESDQFRLSVNQPPTANVTAIHYTYPPYTGLLSRTDS